jgi:hypothetical protein
MKAYWGNVGIASRPSRFTPRGRAPGTHWIGGWVGPRAVLDAVVKRKIPSPRRESNPRIPIVQPVAQRYTDWAITALLQCSLEYENSANLNKKFVSYTVVTLNVDHSLRYIWYTQRSRSLLCSVFRWLLVMILAVGTAGFEPRFDNHSSEDGTRAMSRNGMIYIFLTVDSLLHNGVMSRISSQTCGESVLPLINCEI